MPNQGAPFELPAERVEVAIPIAIADLRRLQSGGSGRGELASRREPEHERKAQIAALDAVLPLASTSRCARASQPPPRAISPSENKRMATQNAARAARRPSPASRRS